ncbi:MAG: Diguanylate cyclase/phosphodiesterase [uncultured Campylobacterales bacterium]|uniref:Diguanylate cyclase/phosphodiesterase n=1 Tax=uncultured Campylobacterales bacterium TaxID=352960 RepID=A0A6S6SB34_9BACT|nr:MAG: Diguanylate cyclase/phosphodiesterase [uncultured Campylobacterales bacterium]
MKTFNTKKIVKKKNYVLLVVFLLLSFVILFYAVNSQDKFLNDFEISSKSDAKYIDFLIGKYTRDYLAKTEFITKSIKKSIDKNISIDESIVFEALGDDFDIDVIKVNSKFSQILYQDKQLLKPIFDIKQVQKEYKFIFKDNEIRLHIYMPLEKNSEYYAGHIEYRVNFKDLYIKVSQDVYELDSGNKEQLSVGFMQNNKKILYGYLKNTINLEDAFRENFIHANSKFKVVKIKKFDGIDLYVLLNSDKFREKSFFVINYLGPFLLLISFIFLLNFILSFLIKDFLSRAKSYEQYKNMFFSFLNSNKNLQIIISDITTISANKSFLEYFGVKSVKEFSKKYGTISDTFITSDKYHIGHYINNKIWFKYIDKNNHKNNFKVLLENYDGEENEFFVDVKEISRKENSKEFLVTFDDRISLRNDINELNTKLFIDTDTKLFNQERLLEDLDSIIKINRRKKKKFILFIISIDNIKDLEKEYGLDGVNEILPILSRKLSQSIRSIDGIYKVDNEKFAIVLDEYINQSDLMNFSERIASRVSDKFSLKSNSITASYSMGICIYPDDASTVDTMINNAKLAANLAFKDGGDKYYLYNSSKNLELIQNREIISDMNFALKTNEFYLQYYPQVNNLDEITGIDLVMKWKHPLKGELNVRDFLNIASNTNLIIDIENAFISMMIQELALLMEEHPCNIYIKISKYHFYKESFAQNFLEKLSKHQIKLNLINIKISAEVFDNEALFEDVVKKINFLQSQGINVVIDDYGRGKITIFYLYKIKSKKLIIDNELIDNIENDETKQQILKSIVQIGSNFEISTLGPIINGKKRLEVIRNLGVEKCINANIYPEPLTLGILKDVLQKD